MYSVGHAMLLNYLVSFLTVVVLLLQTILHAAPIAPAERTKPLRLEAWINRLHAIVREHSQVPPKNDTEKKQKYDQLAADIQKKMEGSSFYFKTQVKNVRWKDGVAAIYTEDELKAIKVRPKPTTLRLRRSWSFDVSMTEEEASQIRPGANLVVEAKVIFRPKQVPTSSRSFQQQCLYGLTYFHLGAGYLGLFTTTDYTVKIDKVEYKPLWLVEKEELVPPPED